MSEEKRDTEKLDGILERACDLFRKAKEQIAADLEEKIIDLYSKGAKMELFPIRGSKGESFLYEYTNNGIRPADPLIGVDLPSPGYITNERFKELIKLDEEGELMCDRHP